MVCAFFVGVVGEVYLVPVKRDAVPGTTSAFKGVRLSVHIFTNSNILKAPAQRWGPATYTYTNFRLFEFFYL